MRFRLIVLLPLVALTATACAYSDSPSTPVARNLTWFSYLNGDDMRPGCGPGAPDRYRMVYNGIYIEQVRSYDIVAGTPESPGHLKTRVFGQHDLRNLTLSQPMDAFSPWRGKSTDTPLSDNHIDRLAETLTHDTVGQPLNGRLELASDDFYWIVSACMDGKFQFNAFRWPSPRFKALRFPDLLFAWDKTETPVNPPREVDPLRLYGATSGEDMRNAHRFNMAAERTGIVGNLGLF